MSSNDNGGALEPKVNLEGIEDVAILKKMIQEERDGRVTDAEAKRQLTARAKAAEDKLKEIKPSDPPITQPKEETKPYSILDDDAASLILSGYKPDEVRFIMANGGRKILEDKNSFVTIAVEAKREQRKAEDAAAAAEGSGKSDVLKQFTPEQIKNMKASELEKILPKTY